MKKLSKIKLTQLSNIDLNEREMSQLSAGGVGDTCGCSCAYADSGGSSTTVNMCANSQTGSTSSTGTITDWVSYKVQYSWGTPTSGWGSGVYGASQEGGTTFYWSCTTSSNGIGYGTGTF